MEAHPCGLNIGTGPPQIRSAVNGKSIRRCDLLNLFNSLGKRMEEFIPANPSVVNIFTCGPSVYQRSHIGNYRTFLFEDTLVRYLEYQGFKMTRGMNFTDIEDKALVEARKRGTTLRRLTGENIGIFTKEMKQLRMKTPEFLPRASENVESAVEIIESLLRKGIAYRYDANIYFDPLKFPRFGILYGLDMRRWPKKKIRFHKDTYPGMRWNRGDFIIWHGCQAEDRVCWDTSLGCGWPAWSIQDPSMIAPLFDEPLSIYCGGIDNLVRHHDYSLAILESIRPYPMAKYWLHCHHLHVDGKKMSKSLGNIIYLEMLTNKGFTAQEVRFFLIDGHYRRKMNYRDDRFRISAEKLRSLRGRVRGIAQKARGVLRSGSESAARLEALFRAGMDDDLQIGKAIDSLAGLLAEQDRVTMTKQEAAAMLASLQRIDHVLQVLF
jgi:cysteinyl-tRNA synthetase